MDDLISRQAAISAICNACGKIDCDKMDKCEKLQLPPANCSEFPNNSDTISRQAAIEALDDEITITGKSNAYVVKDYVQRVKRKLENLPFVTPKRKTGKWIEYDSDEDKYDVIKCPCCKYTFTVDAYHWTDIGFVKDDFKFCPNCGADMRQREEK